MNESEPFINNNMCEYYFYNQQQRRRGEWLDDSRQSAAAVTLNRWRQLFSSSELELCSAGGWWAHCAAQLSCGSTGAVEHFWLFGNLE